MLFNKQHHLVTSITVFLTVLLIAGRVIMAEDNVKKIVSVSYPIASVNSDFNMKFARMIYEKLKLDGYEISGKAKLELLFTTTKLPDKSEILVNIIYMSSLPKEVMDYNIKNESMYAFEKNKEKLPNEGKFVREMVTEEMLQNYRFPEGYDSIIISENNLEVEVPRIIEKAIIKINFFLKQNKV